MKGAHKENGEKGEACEEDISQHSYSTIRSTETTVTRPKSSGGVMTAL